MLVRFLWAVLICIFLLAAGCSAKTVATVNGNSIGDGEFVGELRDRHGLETLQQMINHEILQDEMRKKNIKVTDEEISERLKVYLKQSGQDPVEWQRMLQSSGGSIEPFRREIESRLAVEKLATQGIKVSDEEIRKMYDEHPETFVTPTKIQFARILLARQEEADRVYKLLGEGKLFADLVKEYSRDSAQVRDRGGVVDDRPVNQWPQEYLEAMKKIQYAMNRPSPPFFDQNTGFWTIAKVVKETPGEKVKFEEVKDGLKIQMMLTKAGQQGRTPDSVFQTLISQASVTIKEPRLVALERQYGPRGPAAGAGGSGIPGSPEPLPGEPGGPGGKSPLPSAPSSGGKEMLPPPSTPEGGKGG